MIFHANDIFLILFIYMKCPCITKDGNIVYTNLSNQCNPSNPNFNPKYYWAYNDPNWRYQQKVQ